MPLIRAPFAGMASLERVALALCLVAGVAHMWAYRGYQPDDAFIFLVYAKNFLEGNGLTFNGQDVEGFSSPLWTGLLVAGGVTRVEMLFVAKAIGWVLFAGTGAMLLLMARRLREDIGAWTLIALLAMWFALPPAALWASGAMETLLHGFVLLIACALYFRSSVLAPSRSAAMGAGVALGLLAWTRPEGFAFLGMVPAFEACRAIARRRVDIANAATTLGVALLVIAALLAWRHAMYGNFLPITVAAKTGDLTAQWHAGVGHFRDFLRDWGWLAAAWVAASFVLLRRGGNAAWWTGLALIVITGDTLFSIVVGGDWMPGYRFLVPVLPLVLLVIALALPARRGVFGAIVVVLLALEIHATFPLHAMAMEQAAAADGDARMGKYLAGLRLPQGQSIAVVDAGALPYYAGLRTIDMVGLNDEHIARLPGPFMHKWDNAYVLAQRPDWIQLHTYLHDGAAYPLDDFVGGIRLFYSDEFQRWYDWDARSPVAHLFRRRTEPRAGSFMSSFMQAEITGSYEHAAKMLSVQVRKEGGGVWPASPDDNVHNAAVYLRVRTLSPDGAILREEFHRIPAFMAANDVARWRLNWDAPTSSSIQLCLLLAGVGDFPACQKIALR